MSSSKFYLNWPIYVDSIKWWLDLPFSWSCWNRIIKWLWCYLSNMKMKLALYLHFISIPICQRKPKVDGLRFLFCLPIPNPLVFRFAWSCWRNPPQPPRRHQCLGSKRFCSTRRNFTQRKTEYSIWQADTTQPPCCLEPQDSVSLYFHLWNNRYDSFFS